MDGGQHIHDDPSQNLVNNPYGFYDQQQHTEGQYGLQYAQQMQGGFPVVHPGAPPRSLSAADMQGLQYRAMNMPPPYPQQPMYNPTATPPQHVGLPIAASPPPASPSIYDPLSPPVSGSDTSGEGLYQTHSRDSSGAGSPVSSRGHSLVHRHIRGYHPTPSPSGSSGRRSRDRSLSDDEGDNMGHVSLAEAIASTRKEATRRQRIEAEQRRRDELRDGYAKLKDVLPVSNQKSSKVSLLERATNHIVHLEKQNQQLNQRLAALDQEVQRLRALNEKISLAVDTPSPGQPVHPIDSRPLSPPPEINPSSHSLTSVQGQNPPNEESSGSEAGY
ncbi:hypothetical protein PUNSTDRAFT_80751 [Punctularia strigosozonata HHB-11173 SS5]|uniref:uncharacterized protein n=1 Tax=Punctularia strigosozonata (strain HHB-11173) TaxID=741275 RepID=UPI00044176C5|nr:uncharacterized protein PUNSTDRAFT_80751 [Punctularia strigosozonata HHB-11173 SS5]EIN14408.1 hypothetical protein PUNSTDRAFT_80751 [Punctularia strigosozonata HHB-11173 SS5]